MTRARRFVTPMVLLTAVSLTAPAAVLAQGSLNVYCSVQAEWCQAIANEFQRQTGVRVGLTLPAPLPLPLLLLPQPLSPLLLITARSSTSIVSPATTKKRRPRA